MENPNVSHPLHYTYGGIECIDAIDAVTKGLEGADAFCTGQVIKYMWRWKHKNGLEDLQKAQWYLNRLINKEQDAKLAQEKEDQPKSRYAYHVE